jgi:AcrR family transcriptional regulator
VYDVNMNRPYHHGDLKRALIDQATNLIRAGEEPALRRLAADVGVSPSAAYRHFADHSALLDEVAANWLDSLGQQMAGSDAGSEDDGLLAVCLTYLKTAVADPQLFRLASGPHGFGRPGGVVNAGASGPLPQQRFLRLAHPAVAERAWIATHGLAVLTVDGPYTPEDASRLLAPLVTAIESGG